MLTTITCLQVGKLKGAFLAQQAEQAQHAQQAQQAVQAQGSQAAGEALAQEMDFEEALEPHMAAEQQVRIGDRACAALSPSSPSYGRSRTRPCLVVSLVVSHAWVRQSGTQLFFVTMQLVGP